MVLSPFDMEYLKFIAYRIRKKIENASTGFTVLLELSKAYRMLKREDPDNADEKFKALLTLLPRPHVKMSYSYVVEMVNSHPSLQPLREVLPYILEWLGYAAPATTTQVIALAKEVENSINSIISVYRIGNYPDLVDVIDTSAKAYSLMAHVYKPLLIDGVDISADSLASYARDAGDAILAAAEMQAYVEKTLMTSPEEKKNILMTAIEYLVDAKDRIKTIIEELEKVQKQSTA